MTSRTSQPHPSSAGPATAGLATAGLATAGLASAGLASAGPAAPEARRWLDLAAVERPVLDLRPDYTALIIVADGLDPGPSDEATDALLSEAETQARATLAGRAASDLEPVAAWRLAYQAFGAKPKRTRPSVEALLRRVEAGLPRIDRLTDIYNAISVRHLLPVGGEDLAMYCGPARLARAAGHEPFDTMRDGQPVMEHPEPGEVIWRDDDGVTCRCWNWRQCVRTRITHATTSAMFILDGLAELGPGGLMTAGQDLAGQLAALHPGARLSWRLIGADATASGVSGPRPG
jgi:DNA/RNA-binding domain of Phe-tRNA-synthetase-like protein